MKFIADAMLGKLATWMRVLGYDVEYFRKISDDEILELARTSGRTVLTRDTLLMKRRKARTISFLVEGDFWRDQLRQVTGRFPLPAHGTGLSRCLRCNELLEPIEKTTVKGKVPPYVYETQERFLTCPSCRRIYWCATHVERMDELLRSLGLGDGQ